MRGPGLLPREPGRPRGRTSRARFDALVVDIVEDLERRWRDRLGWIEYAVEDMPQLPDDWGTQTVPLSSLVRGDSRQPTRLVVFRRPIERRCDTRADLEAMVLTVLVEQVAELLGIAPEDVDPRYRAD